MLLPVVYLLSVMIERSWKFCTRPKFSPFVYLNAIAFKNFKTPKM